MDLHPIQVGVEILLIASCYRNWDKLQPDGPLGSHADSNPFTTQIFLNHEKCYYHKLNTYNMTLIISF